MNMTKKLFIAAVIFCIFTKGFCTSFSETRKQFSCPPDKYRPYTWWHWMDGNITKEGITTDLEAMKKAGIGGALMFHINQGIPVGPVRFGTPDFYEMVQFAIDECERLGLEFGVNNCDGWSSSGGPWVSPEHSMKFVTYTETLIGGGRKLELQLPKPFCNMKYSDDIGVFAFPATGEDIQLMTVNKTATSSRGGIDASKLTDNDMTTKVVFPKPEKAPYDSVVVEYEKVVDIGGFRVVPGGVSMDKFRKINWISPYEITFFVSLDGKDFKKVDEPVKVEQGMTKIHTFLKPLKGRAFKFEITGFPWVENVELAELELLPPSRMTQLEGKVMKIPDGNQMVRSQKTPNSEIIPKDKILDISEYLGDDGMLKWQAPPGQWVILRLSQTTRARENTPPSIEGKGLEVDKLSKQAADVFWDGYVGKLIDQAKHNKSFKYIEVDSWEVGYQNWTDRMDVSFEERTGYSMRPFLPVFSGRIVESEEMTERFLWDFRRVISDMAAENYIGYFQEKAKKHRMEMYNECYHGPFDCFEFGGKVFSPMGEFWVGGHRMHTCKLAASVGHVYGKEVVSAEAFTAEPSRGAWDNHPYTLKALGDDAFANGINQFVFHRFTHQPYPNAVPGMTMGQWGAHIDRTQTWWKPAAKSWFDYLHRSQYMLRQGRFFADVAFYTGERQPHNDDSRKIMFGYDYDAFSREILLSAEVKNGQIVLPSGMRYNLLVLPEDQEFMSLQVARKIRDLAKRGAKILGKKKPVDSPGLIDYPNHSTLVKEIVNDLWDNGHIIQDKTIAEAIGIPEDFSYTSQTEAKLKYIHRVSGDVDFYFVANSKAPEAKVRCHFRVKGRIPELWYPETGKIEQAKAWRETAQGTEVAMVLNDSESVFVVFEKSNNNVQPLNRIELPEIKTEIIQTLNGPWNLKFPKLSGAPESTVLDSLISWTDHELFDIKYFSGTATYVKSFNIQEKDLSNESSVWIDLGEVHEIAEVCLNGQTFAVLWKPPFKIDVSNAIRPGINNLEIKVTNLWRNRLIGDEHYPTDIPRWGEKGGIKLIPDWVKKNQKRPEPDRKTVTFYIHWGKNDPLLSSGLLGPVTIVKCLQN